MLSAQTPKRILRFPPLSYLFDLQLILTKEGVSCCMVGRLPGHFAVWLQLSAERSREGESAVLQDFVVQWVLRMDGAATCCFRAEMQIL